MMTPSRTAYNERRKAIYASPGHAPKVGIGVNKPKPLDPERVRVLMNGQRRAVEEEEAAATGKPTANFQPTPAIVWKDEKPAKARPLGTRRWADLTPDDLISHELDLVLDDLSILEAMGGAKV